MNRIRFLFSYLHEHRVSYSFGIICIILTNYLAVVIPEYLQKAIDLLSLGAESIKMQQELLFSYLTILVVLAAVIILIRTFSRILFFNPGRKIEYRLKNDLFHKLSVLPKSYFDDNSIGGITSRLQNDINGIRLLCGFVILQFFNIITALSLTPYKMWQLSRELTLYCILPILIIFIVVRISMSLVVRHTHERMTTLQGLSGFILASLSGIDVIRSYHLEEWSKEKFETDNQSLLETSLKISVLRSFVMPLLRHLENVLKIIILLVGGIYVIEGTFTIGEFTAFIAYAALLTMPIMGLGWMTTVIQEGLVGLRSIETILSQETPAQHLLQAKNNPKELFSKGLQVSNLTYHYQDQKKPTLKNISFEILPEQTVGVLGKIGSGKTTLVNCINQYLQTEPGMIQLSGQDVQELSLSDLRQAVKTVSQDIFLFSDSIENNIAFGIEEDKIDKEKLAFILKQAALEEEITRFPDGVNTIVGEKGIMLSGGQKQRISLARALAGDSQLLVLDNVLSAVDYETERYLLKAIYECKQASSLLIVSHRVQALEKADLILVLDKGEIIQRGTHEQLMQEEGFYHTTWQLQNKNQNKNQKQSQNQQQTEQP